EVTDDSAGEAADDRPRWAAASVRLAAFDDRSLELVLHEIHERSLAGRLVDRLGRPVAEAGYELAPDSAPLDRAFAAASMGGGTTRATGTFMFRVANQGPFRVRFRAPGQDGQILAEALLLSREDGEDKADDAIVTTNDANV